MKNDPLDPAPRDWEPLRQRVFDPLKLASSEIFVAQVMREIRQLPDAAAAAVWAWPRWALPTLALSVASLLISVTYQPSSSTWTDAFTSGSANSGFQEVLRNTPSDDVLLGVEP